MNVYVARMMADCEENRQPTLRARPEAHPTAGLVHVANMVLISAV